MSRLSSVTKKRLEEHCRYLERVHKKHGSAHFNMNSFLSHENADHAHELDTGKALTEQDLNTCGTTACSMGYFAVSPMAKRFRVEMHPAGNPVDGYVDQFFERGRRTDAFNIARRIFRLSREQTHFLFGARSLIKSPKEWTGMCRAFIALDGDVDHPLLRGFTVLHEAIIDGKIGEDDMC